MIRTLKPYATLLMQDLLNILYDFYVHLNVNDIL